MEKCMTEVQERLLSEIERARTNGWTYEQIGDLVYKGRGTIHRWLSGVHVPHNNDAKRCLPTLTRWIDYWEKHRDANRRCVTMTRKGFCRCCGEALR